LIASAVVVGDHLGHDIDVEVFINTKWKTENLGSFVFKITYCNKDGVDGIFYN